MTPVAAPAGMAAGATPRSWRPEHLDGPGLSFPRLLRSEWIKLRTLRSTWLTLGAAVLVLVVAAGLIANFVHGNLVHPQPGRGSDPGDRDVLTAPLRGFGVTQLIVGVLGVLVVSGEYATGMIRASLIAVPKRLPVLAAKALVFGALAFASMLTAAFAAFFVAQAVLGSYRIGLSAPSVMRVLVALAGYLTLVGLLGVGIAFIVRSTAGSIASLVGILLVAPGVLAALGTSWAATASHYLPLAAGQAMFADQPGDPGTLSPGRGTLVMLAWVLTSLLTATALLTARDA